MAQATARVDTDELATLKLLALEGALGGQAHITCSGLAEDLGASDQTASRRLQRLEDSEVIERDITASGQSILITAEGERILHREYAEYRRLFEDDTDVTLAGSVTSGMGEGRHYISLPGYMEQFIEKLGYEPFPGTLNVSLSEESVRMRGHMDSFEPIFIEGWEDDERTYGPAFCWPVTVECDDESSGSTRYTEAHVVAPERTHHGDDQLELIAPEKLRDVMALEDGDTITIHVTKQ